MRVRGKGGGGGGGEKRDFLMSGHGSEKTAEKKEGRLGRVRLW
jgi:hypothetical protein